MPKAKYYINGIGLISPQRTFNNDEFLPEISEYPDNKLNCVVPDFKEYINPIQLRRLSRMLRIGLSSATICLRDAKENNVDGIITGTGYGFLTDTAKFLTEIFEYQEKQLTPTYFMQGTYNALAGLVALTLKCKGYNNTYVNRGFAFETSMHDAMMQLNADAAKKILVGGYDERDDAQYSIHLRVNYYKAENISSLKLFESKTIGTLQGEAASFFLLAANQSEQTWCELVDLKMVHCPESKESLLNELSLFLDQQKLSTQNIDVVVSGVSGDVKNDVMLNALVQSHFGNIPELRFKHLSGEYCTASSFGIWLGASVLKKQQIPDVVKNNNATSKSPINTVLLINQYMGRNYSFVLLKRNC
jgi:3-oxoacyl-[acyl-carrier-protein] synthase II